MAQSLIRGKDLVGRPVVDITHGEDVAEVRDVIFNPADGLLVGFTLNGRGAFTGRLREVLPIARVSSVGTGAVLVDDSEGLLGSVTGSDEVSAAAKADDEVVDDLVVTESGQSLGVVRDVVIAGGKSPRVVAFEISSSDSGDAFVPMSGDGSVSASALVVPDSYADRLESDLAGLAEQLGGWKGDSL